MVLVILMIINKSHIPILALAGVEIVEIVVSKHDRP